MAKTGAQNLAKEMLSRIQESLENMRMGQQRASPQQRAMQEMMRQLSDLSHQQQQLMDETYKQHQDGEQSDERGRMGGQRMQQPPRFGKETPRERNQELQHTAPRREGRPRGPERDGQGMTQEQLARAQEQLRHQLGEFMRKLSESINKIPDEFGRAERSMKDAVGTLNKSEPGDVLGSQANALDQMQKGARALNELIREHAANGQGTPNERARGMQDEISPLNRRRSGQGFFDRSRLDIADESDVQKARRLFDELRRRSGDRERPVLELDYIDRLLKRF
jgi:DNA repair ATPase RecN